MIELIDLSEWKNQKDIILELHREHGINISSRQWRIAVANWNKKFANHEVDYYITHSNSKGFKATKDYQEAIIGRNDYLKRAYDMIKKAKECDVGFNNLQNYYIDFEEGKIV